MTTFSQAIDKLVIESARQDLRLSIETWMNQTIRDVHAANVPGQQAMPVKFGANLIENIIATTSDNMYVWPIPNRNRHQLLIAAYYPDVDKYAHLVTPGTINLGSQEVDYPYIVYRSGDNYVFDGYGETGSQIQLAYYEYPKRLIYYVSTINNRPATYDDATELYTYNTTYNPNIPPNDHDAALALTTNWLLERWEDLIMQGTRSKIYNRTADDIRAKSSYSAYMEQRPVMVAAESMEFIGFYRG